MAGEVEPRLGGEEDEGLGPVGLLVRVFGVAIFLAVAYIQGEATWVALKEFVDRGAGQVATPVSTEVRPAIVQVLVCQFARDCAPREPLREATPSVRP